MIKIYTPAGRPWAIVPRHQLRKALAQAPAGSSWKEVCP
jgi:hypothetical protein